MLATNFIRQAYRRFTKPVLFRFDPELVHDHFVDIGRLLGSNRLTRRLTARFLQYRHPSLRQRVCGLDFANPVGLAAGFDKNARLCSILPSVGFGFAEVGSITGEPCPGNPKPRLWRLPKTKSIVVYYGLMNDGCEKISARLSGKEFAMPIGISVAKTNSPDTCELEPGIADYAKAFRAFAGNEAAGKYFTVNISCPNAHGGEPFSSPERLDALLTELDKIPTDKPIFLKLAVDISPEELDALVAVADRHRVQGFVLSNLTKNREADTIDQAEVAKTGKGGISGKPCFELSNGLISHLYKTAGDRYAIIGVGGIFSAEDAYRKICCGASLVQLITGMIFQGPQLIGEINRGLVSLLKRDGFNSLAEAVGSDHRE